jgi:hypothetical protein
MENERLNRATDVPAADSGSAPAEHRRQPREATWKPSRSAAQRGVTVPGRDRHLGTVRDALDRDSKRAPVERAARRDHEAIDSSQSIGEGPYYLAFYNQAQIGVEVRRVRAPRRSRAARPRSRSAPKRPIPAAARRTPARAVIFRIETAVATGSTTVF